MQVDDLIRVFRANQLTMFDDPLCLRDNAERQAANLLLYGPDANVRSHEQIAEREGDVTCLFDAQASFPMSPVVESRPTGDWETSFSFANVTCIIYPTSESEQEQRARLRRAMRHLARQARRSR